MGTPSAQAIQAPTFGGEKKENNEHVSLSELNSAANVEHGMHFVSDLTDLTESVGEVMADAMIPGFEEEVLHSAIRIA